MSQNSPQMKSRGSAPRRRRSGSISAPKQHSRGLILPVTLVLLLVLITAGAVAARNAAMSEQISNNFRTSNVAFQAAEIGIRYCEAVAIDSIDKTAITLATDQAKISALADFLTGPTDAKANWKTLSNWKKATKTITVPTTFYKPTNTSVDSAVALVNAPTCMIERLHSSTNERFLITARGRSNDSKVNDSEQLTQGSEIWLQSTLKRPS